MSYRAALPAEAMTMTPGYSWRLDLDVLFDDVRPDDWPDWTVRMHVWGSRAALEDKLTVTFEAIEDLKDAGGPVVIPVIRATPAQTTAIGALGVPKYLIDLASPGGEPEDYFSGAITVLGAPPPEVFR